MEDLGLMIMLVGLLLFAVGALWFVLGAFVENVLWGFAILFVPGAALVYLFKRTEVALKPALLCIAGLAIALLGDTMMGEAGALVFLGTVGLGALALVSVGLRMLLRDNGRQTRSREEAPPPRMASDDLALEQAIALIKAGDKGGGKEALIAVLKRKPTDDVAWYWMAHAVESETMQRESLEEALKYNPWNKKARSELKKLGGEPPSRPEPAITMRQFDSMDTREEAAISRSRPMSKEPSPALSLVVMLAGLALIVLSVFAVRNETQLRQEQVVTEAQVTEARTGIARRGRRVYEVKYQFYVAEQEGWYTPADETGREDLWVRLSEEEWRESTGQQRLQVVYLPADPWVNRPASDVNSTLDGIAGGALGVILTVMAIVRLVIRKDDG